MKYTVLVSICIMLCFCSGSGDGPETGQTPPPQAVFETIGGVENVRNPGVPLYPEDSIILEKDCVFDGNDENGEPVVFRMRSFTVDGRGNVYFYDHTDRQIKMFDKTGKYVRSIGRKGQGPGELMQSVGQGFLPDGTMIVLDYGNYRTSYFDENGKYLYSNRWGKALINVFFVTDSLFLTRELHGGWDSIATLYAHDGRKIRGVFTHFHSKMYESEKLRTNIPFSPQSVVAGDNGNGLIFTGTGETYSIEVYDQSGKKCAAFPGNTTD